VKLERAEYYERREREFVAWFKNRYGREPDHRDVEKRWDAFVAYEAKARVP
jgi:hypothetical protein